MLTALQSSPFGTGSIVQPALFETTFGWSAVCLGGRVLQGLVFGFSSQRAACEAFHQVLDNNELSAWPQVAADEQCLQELVEQVQRFTEGEPICFDDVTIAEDHLSPFALKVVRACRRIPFGKTLCYGQLAARCGSPGAARAVGSVMANNRYPLVVPCHRVLAASDGLGGYSAPGGLQTKRKLLQLESALR